METKTDKYWELEKVVKCVTEKFNKTNLGRFEAELEKIGVEDPTPDVLENLYVNGLRTGEIIKEDGVAKFNLRPNKDLTNIRRFRNFVRKNLGMFSIVLVTAATLITSLVISTKWALKRASKNLKERKKKREEEKGGGGGGGSSTNWTPLEPASKALDWLSYNLLLAVSILLFLLLKKR